MTTLLLHHYPLSPFAEKIRRLLAYKQLDWLSVEQPLIAPKPELTPLTGGYRRIPVLQIGADIYCDTALIARVIERVAPEPTVLPPLLAGTCALLEDWADHRFFMQTVPPTVVRLLDQLPPEFIADRTAMHPAFSREAIAEAAPHALEQALLSLDRLDDQLRRTPFLLGQDCTLADLACFNPVWFMQFGGELFQVVRARAALWSWYERMSNFVGNTVTELPAAEALTIARAATPLDVEGGCAPGCEFQVGERVRIGCDDYGRETTEGEVLRMNSSEIVVRRVDPEVGEVAVHFPLAGYRFERVMR